jgi:hypothetical protein
MKTKYLSQEVITLSHSHYERTINFEYLDGYIDRDFSKIKFRTGPWIEPYIVISTMLKGLYMSAYKEI